MTDLREPLAEWITSPDNHFFAQTMANRVWADLMGRGLVEPVDDLRDLDVAQAQHWENRGHFFAAAAEALEEKLPERYHVEINRVLVPFGKHVCTGRLPKCSTCPVLAYCEQVGVGEHR